MGLSTVLSIRCNIFLVGLRSVCFTRCFCPSRNISDSSALLNLAAAATIGLITWYVGSMLRSGKMSSFICFFLVVQYGFVFTLIQLQDLCTLLMGSVGAIYYVGNRNVDTFHRKDQMERGMIEIFVIRIAVACHYLLCRRCVALLRFCLLDRGREAGVCVGEADIRQSWDRRGRFSVLRL